MRGQMVDASSLEFEMDSILEQVGEVMASIESDEALAGAGVALAEVVRDFPVMGFSWRESYTVLRFLSMLNRSRGELEQYADTEEEVFLCQVIAAGVVTEIIEFVKLQKEMLEKEEESVDGEIN